MSGLKVLVKLDNFVVRSFPHLNAPPPFKNPLSLSIHDNERWAVVGSHKTDFLKTVASRHIPASPLSLTYPFLNKKLWPSDAIELMQFDSVMKTAHLSARYEFFKDLQEDQTVLEFISGYRTVKPGHEEHVSKILSQLNLSEHQDKWAMGLSNGQMRRARFAKALYKNPKLLIVDDPALGLDPSATELILGLLGRLPPSPHVILGLRYQDPVPNWITHVAIVDKNGILANGEKSIIEGHLQELREKDEDAKRIAAIELKERIKKRVLSKIQKKSRDPNAFSKTVIKLDGVAVCYRGQTVFKDINWEVKEGEKWHIRGNNGTGKSTLLSLITADHPQSWNKKIQMFGQPRQTGKSDYFSTNDKIGHVSPEIHALFPKDLTSYQAISTGFLVGSFVPPKLTANQEKRVQELVDEFGINPDITFRDLSISDQKTVLFARAILKNPDILILDEALSAMDDSRIEQCKEIIDLWTGTVLIVGHVKNEVPTCDKYIQLSENGKYEISAINDVSL